jgi:hypothetical protein
MLSRYHPRGGIASPNVNLPGEESRILGRILVYTAITRSGCEFHLFAGNNALRSLLDAAPFLP